MIGDQKVGVDHLTAFLRDNARAIDNSESIPSEQFDTFAAAGLYGAIAPKSLGGLDLDLDELCTIVEQLASTCLTTTFVWIQHFRLLMALLDPATPEVIRDLLPLAVSGQLKGGVALSGLLPGPPLLRASESNGGWRLDGAAPWVSGWGIVDKIYLTARGSDENVLSFVIDATEQSGLGVSRHHLSAMNASSTVGLTFSDFYVPTNRFVGSQPYAPGLERPEGLRANGSLALGVTRRCCELLGHTSLDDELQRCRDDLAAYDTIDIAQSRARAAALAVRAAHVLSVSRGSKSAISGDIAERTTREAALLLVFASRPAIKSALLDIFLEAE